MIQLRPYQKAAKDAARDALSAGARAVCLVSPTGSGKTVLGSAIAAGVLARGNRVLWLAHRAELVDQAAGTLERLGLPVGLVAASSSRPANPAAPVQVASIQTLLARDVRPPADVVIFDEAHHAASATYSELVAHYRARGALIVGLTATPERGDGRGLAHMFDRLVVVARISDLISEGHLVPCEVVAPAALLRPGQIARRPVDAYRQHALGRPTLVFSPTIMVAEQHAEEFRAAGIEARLVEGRTPADERRAALEDFRAGRLPVLVNVAVLTEGTDLPIASAAILARGCGTTGLYLQIAGRILRPHPSKRDAVLIDLRGVSHEHGHPAEDRVFSLEGRGITRAGDKVIQAFCRVCGAPIQPASDCEECGIGARDARQLQITNAALVKFARKRAEGQQERAQTLARWIAVGRAKGYKPGWALGRYNAVYGGWAPRAVLEAAQRMAGGEEMRA